MTNLSEEILTRHNRELRERNAELEEEVSRLKALINEKTPELAWIFPYLGRQRATRLLEYLVLRDVATKEGAMQWIYGHELDPPEPKILDVYMCHIRRALVLAFPHEETVGAITTLWGRGWSLTPYGRRLIASRSVDKSADAA